MDHEQVLVALGGVDDLVGGVGERDLDARARALDQPGRVPQLLDLLLEPLDRVVVDLGGERRRPPRSAR